MKLSLLNWILISLLAIAVFFLLRFKCQYDECKSTLVINDTSTKQVVDSSEWYKPIASDTGLGWTIRYWDSTMKPIIITESNRYIPYKENHPSTSIPYDSLKNKESNTTEKFNFTGRTYQKRFYNDTLRFNGGYVNVQDSVIGEIAARRFYSHIEQKEITKTITLTEPKRTRLFLGIEAGTTKKFNDAFIGINAMLLNKKGTAFEIQTMYVADQLYYGGGVKFELFKSKNR